MGYLLCLLALVTLLLGMPISFAMGTIGLAYLLGQRVFADHHRAESPYTGMADSFLLLAIPFFLLAGALDESRRHYAPSGGGFRLYAGGPRAGGAWPRDGGCQPDHGGKCPESTAAADAVATGTVLIPSMIRNDYLRPDLPRRSAQCAAAIGPLVPPSDKRLSSSAA